MVLGLKENKKMVDAIKISEEEMLAELALLAAKPESNTQPDISDAITTPKNSWSLKEMSSNTSNI
jgi:hypothetical protein